MGRSPDQKFLRLDELVIFQELEGDGTVEGVPVEVNLQNLVGFRDWNYIWWVGGCVCVCARARASLFPEEDHCCSKLGY